MEPKGLITMEVFDKMKAMRLPSSARVRFNHDKKTHIDESVKFWKNALEYVRSNEYTPETYNIPQKKLASNIKAFIDVLKSMRGDQD